MPQGIGIDASIPLGVKTPQFENPFSRATKIQNDQVNLQRDQLARDKAMKDQADEDEINRILSENADDPDKAADEITRRGYGETGIKIKSALYDQRTKYANQRKAELEGLQGKYSHLADVALGIKAMPKEERGQAFTEFRNRVNTDLGPEFAKQMGDSYDDAAIDRMIAYGGKMKDAIELESRGVKQASDALELENKGRDSQDAWTRSMANRFSLADTPQHWDALYQEYMQAGPSARKVLQTILPARATFKVQGPNGEETQSFGPQWSKEAQKAMTGLAMTADQRADNARQDAAAVQAVKDRALDRAARVDNKDDTQAQKDAKEEAAFPKDVRLFVGRLPATASTRKQAVQAIKDQWPAWVVAFPSIDSEKVMKQITALYGPDRKGNLEDSLDSTNEAAITLPGGGVKPTATGKPPDEAAARTEAAALAAEFRKPTTTIARKREIQKRIAVLDAIIK